MNITSKFGAAVVFAALATTSAQAVDVVTGGLWHVPEAIVNSPTSATPGNVPGTTPDVTFSLDSPFSFSGTSVSVGSWLASSASASSRTPPARWRR